MKNASFPRLMVIGLMTASASVFAEPRIEQTVVGPANAGGVYGVSPRGGHVAFATTKGSRLVVSVDGVEGPVFDELFVPNGQGFYAVQQTAVIPASSGGQNANTSVPVIFNDDGNHYAYAARRGSDYVVIHDGKEIHHGARTLLAFNYGALTLSPTGRRVYWTESEIKGSSGRYRVVIDGRAGAWSGHQTMPLTFSADDARYAYPAMSEDRANTVLIVDGKEAGYAGMNPMFTADGEHLITIAPVTPKSPKPQLLVDGRPVFSGISIDKVVVAPVGHRYAALVRTKLVNSMGVPVLVLDGREVSGTDGAVDVWFSPDGKHYAVSCTDAASRAAYMVIDGKKGREYQGVGSEPVWTRDSSRLVYTVSSGGRNFVVVDGQESDSFEYLQGLLRPKFALGRTGGHYAYSTFNGMNRVFSVVVDGKSVLPANLAPVGDSFSFSADGSHFAFAVSPIGRNEISGLVVDGVLQPDFDPYEFYNVAGHPLETPYFLLSDDGSHLVSKGVTPSNASHTGLFLDGKLVFPTQRAVMFPMFTPDNGHLLWVSSEIFPDRPQPYFVVYVDGRSTGIRFSEDAFMKTRGGWDMNAEGVVTFFAIDGNDVKRYRVSAGSDTSIATIFTDASAREAKSLADAEAARTKAEADAARLKAEKEAAAVKAKADYDAAVAAKAKARQDALEAKKKAAADAAAAKAQARADAAARKKK